MLELILILNVVHLSLQISYEFEIEDESIYSDCSDVPPGTLNISGLFDLTNYTTTITADGLSVSGNMTSVFNAQPTDRIELTGNLLFFDRGAWQPTTLNMMVRDFCAVMYDKKQLWYTDWSSHVVNRDEIKDNCIKVPGTLFLIESYNMKLVFGSGIPLGTGRYSIRVQVFAYDQKGKKRPNNVCYEVKGNFYKESNICISKPILITINVLAESLKSQMSSTNHANI
uniref:Chemosensory protein B 53a n=1 Tax=Drosophila melanogaster TaxID=7227 RepID=A1ZAG5_DROME|nr:chemosensory protein B 53a [Drosophila melanogaster]AAX52701.1 chemosensory protein B 53a [Drosophila melanogaster]|eukprot:NP_001014530.1 chemosensory protein B 53a [Drosophila melanogaster]